MNYSASTSGLNPNYLNALQHQEYLTAAAQRLGELQATAGLGDPLTLEGIRFVSNDLLSYHDNLTSTSPHPTASRLAAASRKRALSTSPFSDLVRNSPAAAVAASSAQPHNPSAAAAAAAANAAASPSSSGSFDALGIPHPLQQAAHLLRGSPYLSPQQNSFLHAAHALHSAAAASAASPYFPLLAPPPVTTMASTPSTAAAAAAAAATSAPPTSGGETTKEGDRPAKMPPVSAPAPPLVMEDASSNVVSSTMEDEESVQPLEEAARSRERSTKGPVIRALASSSTGFDDAVSIKEEPDFVETHCHWVGCDREMGTQDLLVKVGEHRLLEEVYGKTFFVPFSALEQ